jgi:putative sigma-54 modulation protein
MRTEIRTDGIRLDHLLRSRVERALLYSLDRYRGRIVAATVRISDVNGPKGGVDKECRICLDLGRREVLVVRQMDASASAAVDRAAERVRRRIGKILDRRSRRRRRGRGLSAMPFLQPFPEEPSGLVEVRP